MRVSQQDFRAALLDADLPSPPGLCNATGGPAGKRFDVYRNNVVVSLTDALATAFPLLHKLVGAERFARLAGLFVRAHPPTSPLMMFYGEALPDFLERFEPLKHIGYLPDCARLDLALRQSYHAADSTPLDASILETEAGLNARFSLAPATRIIRSHWPLFDIWSYNFEAGAPKPSAVAQDVLVTRPEFDPAPHVLPPGAATWLLSLHQGQTFGDAVQHITKTEPEFDLAGALSLALNTQALVDYTTKETQ